MTISLTKLYDLLSIKMGKEEAENLTSFIEEKIADEFERNKSGIVLDLKLEIEKMRTEMERSMRNQLWAMIALFIPLYITVTIALIHLLK